MCLLLFSGKSSIFVIVLDIVSFCCVICRHMSTPLGENKICRLLQCLCARAGTSKGIVSELFLSHRLSKLGLVMMLLAGALATGPKRLCTATAILLSCNNRL